MKMSGKKNKYFNFGLDAQNQNPEILEEIVEIKMNKTSLDPDLLSAS